MGFLVESIFTGFGVYSILYALFLKREKRFPKIWDRVACFSVPIAGILSVILALIMQIEIQDATQRETWLIGYWIYILVGLVISQLLWLTKIHRTTWLRLFIGVLLINSVLEDLVVLVTRLVFFDHLPGWSFSFKAFTLTELITKTAIFSIYVSVITLLLEVIKRKQKA
ncbi:MAG: hypothetical protein AAF740_15255 [Bacteroidota bacterium]